MTAPTAPAHGGEKTPLLDVAYHHEPYWSPGQGDWIKSLLLFFDGVAVLVPDYMRDRPLFTDPTLAQPLADQGLLHRLSPETLVDQQTAEALTELLDDLLRTDAFDGLDRDTAFAEISHSRLGATADTGLTEVVLDQLRERGLARPSADGVSIPLHPAVRAFVLIVLPQLLRAPAEAAGYALQPASTQPRTARALMDALTWRRCRPLGTSSPPTSSRSLSILLPCPSTRSWTSAGSTASSTAPTPATSGSSSATQPR